MAIVSISRIQHRRGLQQDIPQLASAELGWSLDSQKLYIGNGPILEGAPRVGNTEILTEHSDILQLAQSYTYLNEDAGYTPTTGGQSNRYTSIAYGNGTYVVVGTNGGILTSTDSTNWTPVYGGTSNTLNSVCYGNNLFVAVGASGTIIYSSDGAVWNKSTSSVLLTLTSVIYAPNITSYVATSTTGSIINSANANTWQTVVSGGDGTYNALLNPPSFTTGTNESLNAIAYHGGTIVVVGNLGTIITSTDGNVWTAQDSMTDRNLTGISWSNDQWIASGDYSIVIISVDAVNWIFGFTDTIRAAAHNTGVWVFVGDGGAIYRSSGAYANNLVQATSVGTTENIYDVIYSTVDNKFIAVGANGTILTSQSGNAWIQQTISSPTGYDLNKIVYDSTNLRYIAVGEHGTILTCNNMDPNTTVSTWTAVSSGVISNLYGIAIWPELAHFTYIIVGDDGVILKTSNTNATGWTQVTGLSFAYDYRSIVVASLGAGSYQAVAVGLAGSIIYSANYGTNWTDVSGTVDTSEDFNGVNYITWTYNGTTSSRFFAVGNNATIFKSQTGLNASWTVQSVPADNHMFNIYYGTTGTVTNFWVVGSLGYSTTYGGDITDSTTLTTQSQLLSFNGYSGNSGPTLYTSLYGNSVYALLGQYDSILISSDGQNFVSQTTQSFSLETLKSADIYSCIIVSGLFTAVGNKGLVLTSSNGITWNGTSYVYGSSKTTRSLQHKLDEFVTVKDFGAKGDGLTDDTNAINRALYEIYCRTVNPSARKILHFPAGRYIISDGINVPSNAILRGEGTNNTIIQQTADPTFISYVMTTADSKQQIAGQIGYNGATYASDIMVEDMSLESPSDGVQINAASRIVFSRVRMTGSTNLPIDNGGDSYSTGVTIVGSTMTPPTDINFTDCIFEKFNYGVYQSDYENSRNIIFNSTTFYNCYQGLALCINDGMVNTMTISNCVFDLIYDRAINANHVINVTSTFNSYRDVGNNRGPSPITEVINFGGSSVGCASINDQFDRSETLSYTKAWVVGNTQTSAWFGGHNLRIGYYSHQGGESYTLYVGQTNTNISGLKYTINDSTYNQRIQYMIVRDSYTRSGILQLVYNTTTKAYSIDDDSSQTGDVGVVFGVSSDNTYLTLNYTSTAGAATVFTLATAESYVKTTW